MPKINDSYRGKIQAHINSLINPTQNLLKYIVFFIFALSPFTKQSDNKEKGYGTKVGLGT